VTALGTATDYAPLLERCFFFDAIEASYPISGLTGRLPAWLRGVYYVNGPARFERVGARCRNWLDGDGMVCSLRFGPDGVHYTSRFVETPKLRAEQTEGRFVYRSFGTAFAGDRLRRNVMLEPPVNVAVFPYAGKLLAFGEQTLPFELDPVTLETRGEYDFQGALNEVSPFAAHAKLDRGLLNFGISFSATNPVLHVYEFDDDGSLQRRRRYEIHNPHSLHDFGVTPRHAIFFLGPLLMNFQRFWDGASVMDSLTWEPERGSRILVAPRRGNDGPAFFVPVGSGYSLHVINCFETEDTLVVDVIELVRPVYGDYQPLPELFTEVPCGRPVRYIIDLSTHSVRERLEMPYNRTPDFPAIDSALTGSAYNDFWMLGIRHSGKPGRKFFDQLAHGSWRAGDVADTFDLPAGEYFGGEPVCVANPSDPAEAVVIVQHLEPASGAAEFLVFDAHSVRSGPLARLPLRNPIHPGFHSCFVKA
jgi:all-trans-8'-apo-beta-carotenal 15,15'-oxygenase